MRKVRRNESRHLLWWVVIGLRGFAALVCFNAWLERVSEFGPRGGWTIPTLAWFVAGVVLTGMALSVLRRPEKIPPVVQYGQSNIRKVLGFIAQTSIIFLFLAGFLSGRIDQVTSAALVVLALLAGLNLDRWLHHRRRWQRAPAVAKPGELTEADIVQLCGPNHQARELLSTSPVLDRMFREQLVKDERDLVGGYRYVQPSDTERSIGKKAPSLTYIPRRFPSDRERGVSLMSHPLPEISWLVPSAKEKRIGKMPKGYQQLTLWEAFVLDVHELFYGAKAVQTPSVDMSAPTLPEEGVAEVLNSSANVVMFVPFRRGETTPLQELQGAAD